ncbi:DASH complex subunit ask1 [Monascus purpureus]|uniref:DASH complex subunit ASK1 n=1 Tax=Monascus purpureus TaxID=5098 RepID=A0A507R1W0_MONPU|nr:DASH complex subunit ask1 [Monascus purpureus]BDD59773.1 hypothetical protein MAP00_004963 [Monascus purpureus]
MSRPSSRSQRPLTLTEELEKLEQSITLTLQEIDHNFSQAHRIVTTSILPLVEQYAEHSRDVWEGAKFWKQFFEASANVSLSGYEENPEEDTTTTQDQTVTEGDSTANTTQHEDASYETPSSENIDVGHRPDDLDLTSLTLSSHSTPRAAHQSRHIRTPNANEDLTGPSIAYSSPYENLRKQIAETKSPFDYQDSPSTPTTPGISSRHQGGLDASMTPTLSPFIPPVSHGKSSTTKKFHHRKPSDPVMHHVLDKTYRIQATPHGKGYGNNSRPKFTVTPKNSSLSKYPFDDSPISSPEPEAPQLHTELFSPLKTPNTTRRNRRGSTGSSRITPQPGVSVLTPARNTTTGKGKRPVWDSDDDFDDDDDLGPSPPKTMQFHIPQSRLMKTPAKEASKRIVSDLLTTAGAESTTDDFIDEQSPSIIRRIERLEDETF